MPNLFGFQSVDFSVAPAVTQVHIGYCKVNNVAIYNHGTTGLVCLQLFDLGRVPILGTDKPQFQFACPSSSADQGTNQYNADFLSGLKFVNGLAYAFVTAIGGSTLLTGGAGIVTGSLSWEVRP